MATMRKLILAYIVAIISIGSATVVRRCEHQTLSIRCASGYIIRINSANYGRTAGGAICPSRNIRTTRCIGSNSFSIVSRRCNGESACSIRADNGVFGDPCRGTFKYLQVDYTCVRTHCQSVYRCEHSSVNLHCPARQFVHICDAMYGRKVPGSTRCPSGSIRTTNCEASNSLSRVRAVCQGRSSCSVAASNHVFSDPCRGTYKYLEVDYTCGSKSLVCEHRTLQLRCRAGTSILILDAVYGRQAGPEICPDSHIRNRNCRAGSSLHIVRNRCDGRSSCSVSASNGVFGDPCRGTFKYLEVIYKCL